MPGFGEDDGVMDSQSSVEALTDIVVTEPDGTRRPATQQEKAEIRAHDDLEKAMVEHEAAADRDRYDQYYQDVLWEARERLNEAAARDARMWDDQAMEQAMQQVPESRRMRLQFKVQDDTGATVASVASSKPPNFLTPYCLVAGRIAVGKPWNPKP